MTIESVTHAKDVELRRILASKHGYIVCPSPRDYNSVSRIISRVAKSATMMMMMTHGTTVVLPFSIVFLKRTEIYDLVKKLLAALGVTKRKHIMLLADGDENCALEEMFDDGDIGWTLEELSNIRSDISAEDIPRDWFISENNTIVRI